MAHLIMGHGVSWYFGTRLVPMYTVVVPILDDLRNRAGVNSTEGFRWLRLIGFYVNSIVKPSESFLFTSVMRSDLVVEKAVELANMEGNQCTLHAGLPYLIRLMDSTRFWLSTSRTLASTLSPTPILPVTWEASSIINRTSFP